MAPLPMSFAALERSVKSYQQHGGSGDGGALTFDVRAYHTYIHGLGCGCVMASPGCNAMQCRAAPSPPPTHTRSSLFPVDHHQ